MFATIGITSILTGLPWLMVTVDQTQTSDHLCYLSGHPDAAACAAGDEANGLVYLVFVSQFINGIAASCLYSLVPSFIESNTDSTRGTTYLSYFLASGPFGVAFGFVAQGMAINAGVWGLLFLLVGLLLVLMSCFMWRVPSTFDIIVSGGGESSDETAPDGTKKKRRSSLNLGDAGSMKAGLAAFGRDAAIILKNGVWWLFALAASVEAFFVVGINNYGPKIFSSYFSISTGSASMISGALLVPAAVFGQIAGGLCDSKRSKNLGQTASLTKYIALVAFATVVLIYAVQCDTLSFEGRAEAECGEKCHCVDTFDPVCEGGDTLHFNGCYAGCSGFDEATGAYGNCTLCGGAGNGTAAFAQSPTQGVCDSMKCTAMPAMLIIFFVAVFMTFMNNPPSQMVMMRVVPPHLAANALALNDLTYRVIGSLPSVPVWAAAIDSTCMHRNKDQCGVEGECGYYDNGKLALLFLLLGGIPKLLSFLAFAVGSWYLSSKMTDVAVKPYDKKAGTDAEGLAGAADSTDVEMT